MRERWGNSFFTLMLEIKMENVLAQEKSKKKRCASI